MRRIGSDPYVDWSIMLAIALLIVIALAYAGYAAYLSVGDKLAAGESTAIAKATAGFDDSSLNSLNDRRMKAEQSRAAALRGYVGPADPAK